MSEKLKNRGSRSKGRTASGRRLILATLGLLLVQACSPSDSATAPVPPAEDSARELARLSVELGALDRRLEKGAEVAWAASVDTLRLQLGRELTDAEQERGREIMAGVLGEFVTPEAWKSAIARIYAERFTAEELQGLVRFYGSPLGRKVVTLEPAITDEIDRAMDTVLGESVLPQMIDRMDEALAGEFGELDRGEEP